MPVPVATPRDIKVVLHNTDGVNPYAVEIAALLANGGTTGIVLVDAANSEHVPPAGVRWRRLLPANFTDAGGVRQGWRLVRGLGTTVWAGLRGHVVVVAWYRWSLEGFTLAVLARCGVPVVLVDHNPVPRFRESRIARTARRALLGQAQVVVVHAERLRALVDPVAADRVVVCPHPPYVQSAPSSVVPAPELRDDLRWLAFIGRMRRDKGVHLLADVLGRVPEDRRRRLGLVLCGMGTVPPDVREGLVELGVTVQELVTPGPIPEQTLHAVLAARPLVLAPYVAATQSGSVILALSLGCEVLAFDKGGIPDVVAAEGLVPNNDLDAFAQAVASGRGGSSVLPPTQWAAEAAAAWSRVVQLAATGRRR